MYTQFSSIVHVWETSSKHHMFINIYIYMLRRLVSYKEHEEVKIVVMITGTRFYIFLFDDLFLNPLEK